MLFKISFYTLRCNIWNNSVSSDIAWSWSRMENYWIAPPWKEKSFCIPTFQYHRNSQHFVVSIYLLDYINIALLEWSVICETCRVENPHLCIKQGQTENIDTYLQNMYGNSRKSTRERPQISFNDFISLCGSLLSNNKKCTTQSSCIWIEETVSKQNPLLCKIFLS